MMRGDEPRTAARLGVMLNWRRALGSRNDPG